MRKLIVVGLSMLSETLTVSAGLSIRSFSATPEA